MKLDKNNFERNTLKEVLQKIYDQPNCRYEVEAQLGEDVWNAVHYEHSESKEYILKLERENKEKDIIIQSLKDTINNIMLEALL